MSLFSEIMKRKKAKAAEARKVSHVTLPPETPAPMLPVPAGAAEIVSTAGAGKVSQVTLSRDASDTSRFSAEDRALRDDKCQFVRLVLDYIAQHKCGRAEACRIVAETRADDFPHLLCAGKNGSNAATYSNFRNWTEGTGKRPRTNGLIDPATGKIDFSRKNVLLPRYGEKHKENPPGDPAFWKAIKSAYLKEETELAKEYRIIALKWKLETPGIRIPTIGDVRYYFKKWYPERFIRYAKKGENYYEQKLRSNVFRDPASIQVNEAWTADTQDCDFLVKVPNADGSFDAVRPKLCVIMDIKSQFAVSQVLVTGAVTNEIIRYALMQAILKYGRPKYFLTDNGKDYKKLGFTRPVVFTPDVNGSERYEHSILRELSIEHRLAEKYNGRVKYVERFFAEMAGYYPNARGYVGHNPETRPAVTAVAEKEENIYTLWDRDEAALFIGAMVDLYHSTQKPDSKYLRGLSPNQAFAPELRMQREPMDFDELFRAFQMPDPKARKVDHRGPGITFENRYYQAVHEERMKLWPFDGKNVMVKFDFFSADRCYAYSLDGNYICELRTPELLPYFNADPAKLAEHIERTREDKKIFDALIRQETGGWGMVDTATALRQPREAFLGKAPLRLQDSRYMVKANKHNPKYYLLKDEKERLDAEHAQTGSNTETVSHVTIPEKKEVCAKEISEADPELEALVEQALTGGFEEKQDNDFTIPTIKEEKKDDNYELPEIH